MMTNYNKELDRLFELARQEEPKASFIEIRNRFHQTLASGFSGTANHWLTIHKGWIFSLTSFSLLFIFSIIIINYDYTSERIISEDTLPTLKNVPIKASILPINHNQDTFSPKTYLSSSSSSIEFPPTPTNTMTIDVSRDTSLHTLENNSIILLSSEHLSDKAPASTTLNQAYIKKLKPQISNLENTPVRFTINERTPTNQLSNISGLARRAGIEYTYVVGLKHKTIQEFNVHMSIPGTTHSCNIQVCVPKKERFEINFGWLANSAGKAISFLEDINIQKAEPKNTLIPTRAETICHQYQANGISLIENNFNSYTKGIDPKASKDALLNTAGYILLKQDSVSQAIELFKLNTRLFSKKANCWDSLGEAYYRNGDYKQAKASFRKALSIDPKLSASKNWLQKIENK